MKTLHPNALRPTFQGSRYTLPAVLLGLALVCTNATANDELPVLGDSLLLPTEITSFGSQNDMSHVPLTLGSELYQMDQARADWQKAARVEKTAPKWNDIYFNSALENEEATTVQQGKQLGSSDPADPAAELWERQI